MNDLELRIILLESCIGVPARRAALQTEIAQMLTTMLSSVPTPVPDSACNLLRQLQVPHDALARR